MKFHSHWAATALFVVVSSVSTHAHAAAVSGQGTWESTLLGRDLDGNLATFEAYYDTALDITWLANANYAGAGMNWIDANAAASLNPYGITGWRLPTTVDADGPDADALGNDGCNQTPASYQGLDCGFNISAHSEMSHLYYVTLGNLAYYSTTGTGSQPGWGLTNTGPFSNVQTSWYWSATEYAPDTSNAWYFEFARGAQHYGVKTGGRYFWVVHSGDVGATSVPVPAAVWLFGSGLVGLFGLAHRRARPA